jgi:8-oxo-dGTP pyrophosphatase MutT (NUDIX family)
MEKWYGGSHVVFHRYLKQRNGEQVLAVLLTKRTQDAPSDPGMWGLVGGKVDDDETPEQAVRREISEEICIDGYHLPSLPLCELPDGSHDSVPIKFYSCQLDCGFDKLSLRESQEGKVEGEGWAWFTESETRPLPVRSQDRKAIGSFFDANTSIDLWLGDEEH